MDIPKLVFVSISSSFFFWGVFLFVYLLVCVGGGGVGIKIVQQYASGRMQKYIVMVQTAFFWPVIWFV